MGDGWRSRDHFGASQYALPREIETDDAVHPLDADVEPSVPFGERLSLEPAARRERAAVGAEHRRHHGVGNADRPATLIDDPAREPPSLVGGRNGILPLGRHPG